MHVTVQTPSGAEDGGGIPEHIREEMPYTICDSR